MSDFEHDPVTDDAAYQELRRFLTDVRDHMKRTGSSPMRIASATKVSSTTLQHYLQGVEKGNRFRISDDTARRLAGWAQLDLSSYQFARVPRNGLRRQSRTTVH